MKLIKSSCELHLPAVFDLKDWPEPPAQPTTTTQKPEKVIGYLVFM